MIGYVYMLTSPENKKYVGRTVDLKQRLKKYTAKSNYDRSPIYREVAKFGFDNFKVTILSEVQADTIEDLNVRLNEWERYYIELYDTVENGLNRNKFDSRIRVFQFSDETKKKMSEKRSGVKLSKEAVSKISGKNAYQSKKVYSEKLGKTFCSLREAAHYVGIGNGCKVSEVIAGKRKSCGSHPVTKEKIDDWVYV